MAIERQDNSANANTRLQAIQAELRERIAAACPEDGRVRPLENLDLFRVSAPTSLSHSVSAQAFCVIAQGSKVILLGNTAYRYDPAHYLITTAELPVASRITEASPAEPYLSLRLELDPALVSSVMVESGHTGDRDQAPVQALDVDALDTNLLDATLRLVRLADRDDEARFMAPMVIREIVYRLLTGAQGHRLRHIAVLNGSRHRISGAIERLRQEYDQPLHIEDIARDLGMSVSGFHHHFKAVTSMSPLQFQKQLRLREARRLMLGEDLDAAGAGYRVGYGDVSQFTREYKRLFGEPPIRDVARLRDAVMETASL